MSTLRIVGDIDTLKARADDPAPCPTYGTRECQDPTHRGPREVALAAFWSKIPNQHAFPGQGRLAKTCHDCRRRRRIRHNNRRRGAALAAKRATDQFWNEQARK